MNNKLNRDIKLTGHVFVSAEISWVVTLCQDGPFTTKGSAKGAMTCWWGLIKEHLTAICSWGLTKGPPITTTPPPCPITTRKVRSRPYFQITLWVDLQELCCSSWFSKQHAYATGQKGSASDAQKLSYVRHVNAAGQEGRIWHVYEARQKIRGINRLPLFMQSLPISSFGDLMKKNRP